MAIAVALVAYLAPGYLLVAVLAPPALHLVYGVAKSYGKGNDPLNEAPNTFRILLASASPWLAVSIPGFLGAPAAGGAIFSAVFLNDEYQRRVVGSIRRGARGGTVALLGIDGSGKSTHSADLERWFRARGYSCSRVPFHRYLFVERLARVRSPARSSAGRARGGHPLRPLLSALDNLAMHVGTSFGRGLEGRVILYDRYIWSTLVKYEALGYPVAPVKKLYLLPRPKCAIVLDVPVSKSLEVIGSRPDHIRYSRRVLEAEREEYLEIARGRRLPVVDASRAYDVVQREIEAHLSTAFPALEGR